MIDEEWLLQQFADIDDSLCLLRQEKEDIYQLRIRLEQALGYFNDRTLHMEQMYNSIDPKYLAMGKELSQSNIDMITKNLERDRFHMNNFLKLSEELRGVKEIMNTIRDDISLRKNHD